MWHELDAEDIRTMSGGDGSTELQGGRRFFWLIVMDVEMLVIAAARQVPAGFGPARQDSVNGVTFPRIS